MYGDQSREFVCGSWGLKLLMIRVGGLGFTVMVIVTIAHLLGSPWWETKTTCRVNSTNHKKAQKIQPPPQKKKIKLVEIKFDNLGGLSIQQLLLM